MVPGACVGVDVVGDLFSVLPLCEVTHNYNSLIQA